jgi:AcrR family transcriptional regulator
MTERLNGSIFTFDGVPVSSHSVNVVKDRRKEILRAAWHLIQRYGFNKTAVGEIAREAGIGKGTIYLYFKSKEEILVALAYETNRKILVKLDTIAHSTLSSSKKIEKMVTTRIFDIYDIVHRSPHGVEMIGMHKPAIVQSLSGFFREQEMLFAEVLRSGMKCGEFSLKEDDIDESAMVLSGISEILTPPYYRMETRKDLERFISAFLRLFLAGLRRDASGGSMDG